MSGEPSAKDGRKPANPPDDQKPSSATTGGHASLHQHQHQTAIAALASLPLKTVVAVFRHQWHKDKARITFAHSEQYMREHDLPVMKSEWPNLSKYRPSNWRMHSFQLRLLRQDLIRHREKFIQLYLDSVIASTRLPKKEPITRCGAQGIRKSLYAYIYLSFLDVMLRPW